MVSTITACLRRVTRPRFFETELGFQGEFLAELRAALPEVGLPGDAVVEQEYQKRLAAHGIDVRPDLIVHVQTQENGDRRRNNFAVFELNRGAGPTEVQEDFANLDSALEALDYPLGVFVNVASSRTQATHYHGRFRERLHFFAVRLRNGVVEVRHTYYQDERLVEEQRK